MFIQIVLIPKQQGYSSELPLLPLTTVGHSTENVLEGDPAENTLKTVGHPAQNTLKTVGHPTENTRTLKICRTHNKKYFENCRTHNRKYFENCRTHNRVYCTLKTVGHTQENIL